MQQNSFPPPPVAPPPPPGFAPAPAFSAPQVAYAQSGFQAPLPAAQQPVQGFAPPAPPAPQGFSQGGEVNAPSLNSVSVSDLNLVPAVNITGQTKFQILSYVKSNRQSGPAYTVSLKVIGSTTQEMQTGATFSLLFKISFDPRKQGGDKSRKKFVAGVFNVSSNAAIDWDAADKQLQGHDFAASPVFIDLDQRANYSRPVLDQNTKQPVPGQHWSDSTWRLSSGG